ncbi:MAG: HDOD domain-containing protein [Pseudomonadota bacterium]
MKVAEINRELDLARDAGPLRDIIIPPCPELLVELQCEVNQGDPDPAVIARIAGSDVAMAAALLRIANSSLYARSRPVRTVAESVSMLGVKPTIAVLTGFLTRNAIRVNSPLLEHFWESSTRRSLAQTCGLFCHVGIPVMLQGLKGYSGTLAEAMARQDRTFTQTENAVHRTDHAVVGALVAKTWRLPPVIAIAVRLHHDFAALRDHAIPVDVRNLIAIASIAEHLVAVHEGVKEQKEWERHGEESLAYVQVNAAEVDTWVDALHPVFEGVLVV